MIADGPVADTSVDGPCADDDADGVCTAVDTWPCGPEPADLPATVTYDEVMGTAHITIQLTNPVLDDTRKLVVTAGATVTLKAQYSIIDCVCPNCLDQIEVGFVPGGRQGCIYNGNPQGNAPELCTTATTGSTQTALTAPTTPGAYTLRFRVGQNLFCGAQTTWWEDSPPPPETAAVHLCVTPP